ncbi:MAG: 5,6-dimethylbenzimidazole synthase [Smithella sp. PtaU1.Bin162]|nr:MAG: 5,6-dimethylbenzimidazole synthase [Smithella sp. PtaU1.Bin162]
MRLSEIIKRRRSVRKFKSDPISKDLLEKIMDLATWAPSAMNRQDWHFVILQGSQKDDFLKISTTAFEHFKPVLEKNFKDKPKIIEGMKIFFETYGNAPVIIMAYAGKLPTGQDDVWSVSLAVQNLMLSAYEEGLGTVWTDGVVFTKEKEINDLIGIKDRKLVCVIPIGYPAEEPKAPPRREGRIQWIGF